MVVGTASKNTKRKPGLKKELSLFQIFIIGVVGAVGTAALFSPAGMTAIAGPGSILAWIIGALFYATIGLTYVELSAVHPEAGGPSRYSLYTHGRFTNLINAFADLIWYLFIPPVEALAVVEGLDYFFPTLLTSSGAPTFAGAAIGVVLLLLFVPFNYFGVRKFGKSTAAFGVIKIIAYVIVALGLAFVFFNAKNFTGYSGGFAPFGFAGIFSAIPLAMFAFGGIRVIPDYAEELKSKSFLWKAIILTIIGQSLIYLLFDAVFVGGINWASTAITSLGATAAGQWSSLSNLVGNPFVYLAGNYNALWLLVIAAFVGIIGPFVTGYIYLGGGSRLLFAMGRSGIVNKSMKKLNETYAIPYISLVIFAIVGSVVAFIAAPLPSIYGLLTDAVVAGYIGFSTNPVAMIISRRQGTTRKPLLGRAGPVIAPMAFAAASLIVFWSGWPSVPYAILILAVAVAVFAYWFKVREHFNNSIWYIVYIAFLLFMTAIGSTGLYNTVPFIEASAIVVVVSVLLFYPWGIASGLKVAYEKKGITTLD